MTTEERLQDIREVVARIDERLKALPCDEHTAKLQTLCANSNYERGYRKGIVWIIGLIAGFGGSALVRIITWALTKM